MSVWEQLTAAAAIGQIFVIALGAFFAYQQINRLRRQQEAELIQRIFATLNEPEFAKALDFVYHGLAMRLTETAYVREIAEGKATVASHPEFIIMHFFNGLGLLVHTRMVGEYPIVQIVASPCIRAWERLAPVVELLRRRYPHAYIPFESLAVRSRAIDLAAISARFRGETPQLREQWETTARELVGKRIQLLDDHDAG
ncbi:MAG: hypothetical protein WAL67_13355 [Candidatus Cybelea sp.]